MSQIVGAVSDGKLNTPRLIDQKAANTCAPKD